MLRLTSPQLELWDEVLPKELRRMPEELVLVDWYLDDPEFFEPFLKKGQQKKGRPTVPIETYVRLMFLKHRYQLSYETLVEEVSDSFKWRQFCRLGISKAVPHSTTLSRLTNRFGDEAVRELNQKLVLKLSAGKLIRGRKLQTDTTVVEADIEHPTDADLMEDGVRAITRTVKKLGELSGTVVEGFRDSTRKMKGCLLNIGRFLKRRGDEAREMVNEITAEAAQTTERVLGEAGRVAQKAAGFIGGCADTLKEAARRLRDQLKHWMALTARALDQTRQRLDGITSIPNRMVSLFDTEARPIRRGRRGKPVEFGYKVQLDEVECGVISNYEVHVGNPSDQNLAVPAVERHIETFGAAPREMATDRGFSSPANEAAVTELGVKRVSMPTRGKRSKKRTEHERQSWFRRLQRWRAGGEATISYGKRCFGLRRSRLRGHGKASTWVGFSVFTQNLVRVTRLLIASRARDG